jgi:hypothetical protein
VSSTPAPISGRALEPRPTLDTLNDLAPPGRSCPLHYLYSPASLARAAELHADTLYVIGGLYGNPLALDALDALLAREGRPASVVFNGDFHWFDRKPELFRDVNERVFKHIAIRGNVETQFSADDDAAGCGCAYPEWVGDEVVERSNTIESALRLTARQFPNLARGIAELPMNLVAQVGNARIAIVHGDGTSLAGWGFCRRTLASERGRTRAAQWLHAANADVFACTHTCEPVCVRVDGAADHRAGVIINNGAAGMPNFIDTRYGVVTRIATRPAAADMPVLYGTTIAGIHIEALALHYNHTQWWGQFEAMWPSGSAANLSYGARIRDGGQLDIGQAILSD